MRRDLLKNKVYGICLLVFGIVVTAFLKDATFLVFVGLIGGYLLVAKEDYVGGDPWKIRIKRRRKSNIVYINKRRKYYTR